MSQTHKATGNALPHSLAPRGLSRETAAAYIGVGVRLFDVMVADGRMPGPKLINRRRVWDRVKLDIAFAALPGDDMEETNNNIWDELN